MQSDNKASALESALAQAWENSGSLAAGTAGVMLIYGWIFVLCS